MREILVALGKRSYPVLIGDGVRHELSRLVPRGAKRAMVVTQDTVEKAGWLDGTRSRPAVRGQHHSRG